MEPGWDASERGTAAHYLQERWRRHALTRGPSTCHHGEGKASIPYCKGVLSLLLKPWRWSAEHSQSRSDSFTLCLKQCFFYGA